VEGESMTDGTAFPVRSNNDNFPEDRELFGKDKYAG
jgi:hypothetical protein